MIIIMSMKMMTKYSSVLIVCPAKASERPSAPWWWEGRPIIITIIILIIVIIFPIVIVIIAIIFTIVIVIIFIIVIIKIIAVLQRGDDLESAQIKKSTRGRDAPDR